MTTFLYCTKSEHKKLPGHSEHNMVYSKKVAILTNKFDFSIPSKNIMGIGDLLLVMLEFLKLFWTTFRKNFFLFTMHTSLIVLACTFVVFLSSLHQFVAFFWNYLTLQEIQEFFCQNVFLCIFSPDDVNIFLEWRGNNSRLINDYWINIKQLKFWIFCNEK